MRTRVSSLALMLVVALPALAQDDSSVNPLRLLGLSFGDTLADVIHSCERAGLTVTAVDTSSGHDSGFYQVKAGGLMYHGLPAVARLLVSDGTGLHAVFVGLSSVASNVSLAEVERECLGNLTRTFGKPTRDTSGRRAPARLMMWRDEYEWIVGRSDDRKGTQVRLYANVDAPVADRYDLGVSYTDLDRRD